MKTLKVLLVKSRSVVTKNAAVTPPLGLMYVASYLRSRLAVEVRLLDLYFTKDAEAAVRRAVQDLDPDLVGVSALTPEAFLAHRTAAATRAVKPGVPVVMGGPYPSSDPDAVLADPNVDVAIIGEGEYAFHELALLVAEEGPRWQAEQHLAAVPGIAYRRNGAGVTNTGPRPYIQDLDALPFPAWDLVDLKRFGRLRSMSTIGVRPYMTMFTSRGCPYHCVFCHQIFGKKFRARSPESVAAEVAEIRKLGIEHIEILDDIANFDRGRFDGMLTTLLERDLHPILSFPNAIRADLMREESVELLRRVGAGEVSIAIETASERLQKKIRKNLDLDRAAATIGYMADRRILTRGFFILGLPTETEAEIRQTIRFAHRSRLHMALFFTANPFRDTEMYAMFQEAGKLPEGVKTIDYEYYGAPFNGSEVPDARFRRLYRQAYTGFYLDPRRAYRILRDRPFWSDALVRFYLMFRNNLSFSRLKEE